MQIAIEMPRLRVERLASGLTVAIKRVPNRVVTLDAWVNTGSAAEDEPLNGVSHFLEHMMFKGTPRYGVGELDKAITQVGGVWNAGTSKDFTHYYVTVAAPFFATALDAISDMLQHALIDPGEFDKEKHVILEEYRRKQDNPWGMLFDELYEAVYESGPYRQTVLGSFASISGLGRDAMADYYTRTYTPDNMIVCVVGDVEPADALKRVEAAFAGFSRPRRPLDGGPGPTRFAGPSRKVLARDVHETYVSMALPGPAITQHADVAALDLASTMLGDGRSSRLYRVLKEDRRIASSVTGGFPTHRHESLFYVGATLDRPNLDAVVDGAMEVLRSLATRPPSAGEIAKARRIITRDICYSTETNTGQSGLVGYYHTLTGGMEYYEGYLDMVNAVTADDIAAVAGRFFAADPVVVALEPPAADNANPEENA